MGAGTQGFLAFWALGSGGAVLLACIWLMHYYSRPGEGWVGKSTTVVSWFFSFAVCFILPIDLVPDSDADALQVIWRVIYWLNFWLSWIFIPLVSDYQTAGEFSKCGRLKYAIRFNMMIYGIGAVIFTILLVIIFIQSGLSSDELTYALTCIANAAGLLMVIPLLGYGVVEVPRSLFRTSGNRMMQLRFAHYRLKTTSNDYDTAKEELYQTTRLVDNIARNVDGGHRLRQYMDAIRVNLPSEDDYDMKDMASAPMQEKLDIVTAMENKEPTLESLVKLNFHVKSVARNIFLCYGLFHQNVDDAVRLEGEIKVMTTPGEDVAGRFKIFLWYLRHDTWPTLKRAAGWICILLSVFVVWGESLIPVPGNYSPIGLFIGYWRDNAPLLVPLWADIFLLYQMTCCSLPLFQFIIPRYYHMAPKNTESYSMMFNALNVMRFWAPLAYNFITMLKIEKSSAFEALMGPMSKIPLLSSSLDQYLPILVGIIAFMCATNLHIRILNCFGIVGFNSSGGVRGTNEETEIAITEGKMALKKEKRKRGLEPATESGIGSAISGAFSSIKSKFSRAPSSSASPSSTNSTSSRGSAHSDNGDSKMSIAEDEPVVSAARPVSKPSAKPSSGAGKTGKSSGSGKNGSGMEMSKPAAVKAPARKNDWRSAPSDDTDDLV